MVPGQTNLCIIGIRVSALLLSTSWIWPSFVVVSYNPDPLLLNQMSHIILPFCNQLEPLSYRSVTYVGYECCIFYRNFASPAACQVECLRNGQSGLFEKRSLSNRLWRFAFWATKTEIIRRRTVSDETHSALLESQQHRTSLLWQPAYVAGFQKPVKTALATPIPYGSWRGLALSLNLGGGGENSASTAQFI